MSASLERGLNPFKYSAGNEDGERRNLSSDFLRVMTGIVVGTVKDENGKKRGEMIHEIGSRYNLSTEAANAFYNSRMDAFRLYLGLPQKHETFGVSDYKPSKSKQDKFYYKINNFLQNFENIVPTSGMPQESNATLRKREVLRWLWINAQSGYNAEFPTEDATSGIMGRYTLTRGEDERGKYVSYYDLWDLGGSIEGLLKGGVLGKSFEIYDRIYIDDPEVMKEEKLKFTIVSPDTPQ